MNTIKANAEGVSVQRYSRRLASISFTREFQQDTHIPVGKWFRITGLPEDCVVVGFGPDYDRNAFFAVLWSETFPEVVQGERVPQLEMRIEVEYRDAE